MFGSFGNDDLIGGNGDDVIYGQQGNDRMAGNNGADLSGGGTGDDNLSDAHGDDDLIGGGGRDTAVAGQGSDACSAEMTSGCEATIPADDATVSASITDPAEGSTVSAPFDATVAAVAGDGLALVELYVDGDLAGYRLAEALLPHSSAPAEFASVHTFSVTSAAADGAIGGG